MVSSNSQENYVKVKKAGRLGNFRAMWKQVCGRWQISSWLISFLGGHSFIFGGEVSTKGRGPGDQVLSSQQYGVGGCQVLSSLPDAPGDHCISYKLGADLQEQDHFFQARTHKAISPQRVMYRKEIISKLHRNNEHILRKKQHGILYFL